MLIRGSDRTQLGSITIGVTTYPIKSMILWGKGDADTAITDGVNDKGDKCFSYIETSLRKYLIFEGCIVALGSVYIDITKGTSKRTSYYSEDDTGTADEWQ